MHICSIELLYLQSLCLASWTNLSAEMAFLSHVPLCSPCVWRSPPQRRATSEQRWHHVLCGHDSPNSWACAMLQTWVYHDVQGMWSCGKPCTGYSEPRFWSACEAITLPRLSAYKSRTVWYRAKAIQQEAERSMCWSIWRPGDFSRQPLLQALLITWEAADICSLQPS